MASKENQITSQLEKANSILIGLKPNITTQDREAAQKELDLGEATVNRYLLGTGKKIHTALDLIDFLKKRIADRERKLAGAA